MWAACACFTFQPKPHATTPPSKRRFPEGKGQALRPPIYNSTETTHNTTTKNTYFVQVYLYACSRSRTRKKNSHHRLPARHTKHLLLFLSPWKEAFNTHPSEVNQPFRWLQVPHMTCATKTSASKYLKPKPTSSTQSAQPESCGCEESTENTSGAGALSASEIWWIRPFRATMPPPAESTWWACAPAKKRQATPAEKRWEPHSKHDELVFYLTSWLPATSTWPATRATISAHGANTSRPNNDRFYLPSVEKKVCQKLLKLPPQERDKIAETNKASMAACVQWYQTPEPPR